MVGAEEARAPKKLNARQPCTAKRCHIKAKGRKTLEPWAGTRPDPEKGRTATRCADPAPKKPPD